jgi:hypothetical protein
MPLWPHHGATLLAGASVDWSPIVLAVAAFLVAVTPGVAAWFQSLSNGRKLDSVVAATNGTATALAATNTALTAKIDALHTAALIVAQAAGGAPALKAAPLTVPAWNQHNDPNPDGQPDPWWAEDCGEQCIAMVVYACRGIEVPQGVVRAQMHGPSGKGLSSPDDLLAQLKRWRFDATSHPLPSADALTYVKNAVAAGRPSIVLGHWVAPAVLHWAVVVEVTPDGVTWNDPWTGGQRGLSAEHWQAAYAGAVVDPGETVRYR